MLLELAGDRAVHRPVAAVVRPHGELVDDVAAGRPIRRPWHLEHLDGEDAGDVELSGDAQGGLGGDRREVGSRSGAGASTSVQMPSVWTVSTTVQAAAWPEGLRATRTASSRMKSTFSSRSRPLGHGPGLADVREPVGQLVGRRDDA